MFKELYRIFFKQNTNYPPQVIPEKALSIIELLDEHLSSTSTSIDDSKLSLVHFQLELRDQLRSNDAILKFFKSELLSCYYYIPRSVAFVVDQSGTWHFIIGVRRQYYTETNDIHTTLWLDALTRTNNARTQ